MKFNGIFVILLYV